MLKSLGKKNGSSPTKSKAPIKASIRFSRSSYIAGDTVSGRVSLTYTPAKPSSTSQESQGSRRTLRATSVQLLVTGTESKATDSALQVPTVHLHRRYTLAGQKDRDEDTAEEHRKLREEEYLRSNARYAPLNGVVLSTAPGDRNESGALQTRDGISTAKRGSGTVASASATSDDGLLGEPQSPALAPVLKDGAVVLTEGDKYALPFSFELPPWLPPSYYCHFGEVTAFLEYMVQVQVTCAELASASGEDVVLREPFFIISAIPLRELLQCHERANIKPSFTLHYRFRQFHANAVRRLLSPGPQSPIDVKVEFLSSTTILLRDRKHLIANMLHPETAATSTAGSASADAAGGPALGTTVMGNVVGGASTSPKKGKGSASSAESRQPAPDPIACLSLRITVGNGVDTRTMDNTKTGGGTIKGILIQLKSRLYTTVGNRDFTSDPFVLAQAEVSGNVPLGTSNVFKVKLFMNTSQFRRAKASGESSVSPPTNISGSQGTVSTTLEFSFPGLETIAEDAPPKNVIVLAEAVDETNRVPYLPNDWRKYEAFTDNYSTSRPSFNA